MARVSRNASIPYWPYSRPTPEYLNPPQGACGSSVIPLITTRPVRNREATRRARGRSVPRTAACRQRATITCSFGPWRDMVIPVAMECLLLDTDLCQLLITHLDSDGIAGPVQLRLDGQAGLGGRVGNQNHDHFMAHQRLAPPVPGDVAKHAMFNLVPLAGAYRENHECSPAPGIPAVATPGLHS